MPVIWEHKFRVCTIHVPWKRHKLYRDNVQIIRPINFRLKVWHEMQGTWEYKMWNKLVCDSYKSFLNFEILVSLGQAQRSREESLNFFKSSSILEVPDILRPWYWLTASNLLSTAICHAMLSDPWSTAFFTCNLQVLCSSFRLGVLNGTSCYEFEILRWGDHESPVNFFSYV